MEVTQGFFRTRTTCHKCQGAGQIIEEACTSCRGNGKQVQSSSIKITIPAGVDNDTRMRIAGEGEPGDQGGPRGDLYCYISVDKHPIFERNGDDIICDIPISYTQAALGAHIEVPTISGMGKLKIPGGTQSGQAFRMKNQGVPNVKGYGRGDEIVRVHIDTPKKLTKEQRKLLEQLQELESSNPSDQCAGFLDKIKDLFG
jgi:molecular chaperone DnaJ